MQKRSFWLLWGLGCVGLIFIKLYLHNRLVNLSYKQQKLETQRIALAKEQNALRMQLLALKDHHKAEKRAHDDLGLVQLKTSQVQLLKGHA